MKYMYNLLKRSKKKKSSAKLSVLYQYVKHCILMNYIHLFLVYSFSFDKFPEALQDTDNIQKYE